MLLLRHASWCSHDTDEEVDECPDCGSRFWPEYAVVTRHLWSRTELGFGLEERTWALHSLATRLPQVDAESVYCERCTLDLDLDLSELCDDDTPSMSDSYSIPPMPLGSHAPFWSDRVVECPDCGKRHWNGFAVAFQYLHELNRLEGFGMGTSRLRDLAWSFAPGDVEYELCEHCTSNALQRPGTVAFFSAKRQPRVFQAQEVDEAVETMFNSAFLEAA